MNPRRLLRRLGLASTLAVWSVASACGDDTQTLPDTQTFNVDVTSVNGEDTPLADPLPANTGERYDVWIVDIEAVGADGGSVGFDGLVHVSVQPGAVVSVKNLDSDEDLGKNVRLKGGKVKAEVTVTAVYGPSRLWVEDLGYQKAEEGNTPACANGANDDEEDVLVDFPNDPGCAFADDDTETGGSFAAGASQAVSYELPSVRDIQGSGSTTPYPYESITVNTEGVHELIVTRYSKDGFYVTDLSGQPPTCETDADCGDADSGIVCDEYAGNYCLPGCRGTGNGCVGGADCSSTNGAVGTCPDGATADQAGIGFNHLFIFTFSTPFNLLPCDRVTYVSGTISEFFGFTELNFPSYDVQPIFKGNEADCKIPEPRVLSIETIDSPVEMEKVESSLVRLKGYHVSGFLGPKLALNNVFAADQSNCDLSGDGKIDFESEAEAACANACSDNPECSEWTGFLARGNYKVAKTCGPLCPGGDADCPGGSSCDDTVGICVPCEAGQDCTGVCPSQTAKTSVMQVQTDGAPEFNPVANRGLTLKAVTGTLRNFSGGNLNWTVESRCKDDVVCDALGCSEEIRGPRESCLTLRTDPDNDEGSN